METGDIQKDYSIRCGNTFQVLFQVTPLDMSGCTAQIVIVGIGTLTMTVTVAYTGVSPYSQMAATVMDTTAWPLGVYPYTITATFPDGTKQPFGHGNVLVA